MLKRIEGEKQQPNRSNRANVVTFKQIMLGYSYQIV